MLNAIMTTYRLQQLTVDIHPTHPTVGTLDLPIKDALMQQMLEVLGPLYNGRPNPDNTTCVARTEEEWKRLAGSALREFEKGWKVSNGETWRLTTTILTARTTYGDPYHTYLTDHPSVLVRINGTRVEEQKSSGGIDDFIKMAEAAIEKDGRLALIPGDEAKEQLNVLKDFRDGNMSYSQMRSMIG